MSSGIELTEIDEDADVPVRSLRSPVGALLMLEEGGWTAASPEEGIDISGGGQPGELAPGICWLSNLSYNDAVSLGKAQKSRAVRICGSDWLRTPLDAISAEWGLSDLPPAARATMMAQIHARVVDTSFEAVSRFNARSRIKDMSVFQKTERAPSLATGLRDAMSPLMDKNLPGSNAIAPRIADALKFGNFLPELSRPEEGEVALSMRLPRLPHVLEAVSAKVPGGGKWQAANLTEDSLSADSVAELKGLLRPVLICGQLSPRNVPEDHYTTSWVKKSGQAWGRMNFPLEEAEILLETYEIRFPKAFVGSGWQTASAKKLLDGLLAACGSPMLAYNSWSAGLVAENILCGAFRQKRQVVAPESVWIAMNERRIMREHMQPFADFGFLPHAGYAGEVRIKVPRDPEILRRILDAAWGGGFVLPPNDARTLRELGLDIPVEQDLYGGPPESRVFASLVQRGVRNGLWRIDQILDQPPSERERIITSFFKGA